MLQREVFRTQRRALHKPPSRTTSWRTAPTDCGTGGEGDDVNGDAPAGPVGELGPVGDAPAGPVGDAPAGPGGDDAVVPAGTIPQHVLEVLRQRLGQDLPCSSIRPLLLLCPFILRFNGHLERRGVLAHQLLRLHEPLPCSCSFSIHKPV